MAIFTCLFINKILYVTDFWKNITKFRNFKKQFAILFWLKFFFNNKFKWNNYIFEETVFLINVLCHSSLICFSILLVIVLATKAEHHQRPNSLSTKILILNQLIRPSDRLSLAIRQPKCTRWEKAYISYLKQIQKINAKNY